jgi:hypothetical protein
MKKSVVILFTNSKTYKEYAAYFRWQDIKEKYNVIKLKSNNNAILNIDDSRLKLSPITSKLNTFLHYCELWRRRHATITYLHQVNVYFGNQTETPKVFWSLEKRFNFLERFLVKMFSKSILNKLIKRLNVILFMIESVRFRKLFEDSICFLLPYTGGLSPEWDYLVWFGNKKKIPTIGIQENWDNVSSKMFLIHHPSHFATWGRQSSSHLRNFHDFKGNIVEIGCLRIQPFYEHLQKIKNNKIFTNFNDYSNGRFNILVVGTGDAGNDLALISMLTKYNQIISRGLKASFNISYRPHPWKISESQISNVQKISRISGIVLLPNESLHSERINQIIKADCVLSFYSTVILESLILGKTCIIPEFILEQDQDFFSLIDDLPHYSGLAMIKCLKLADSLDELIRIMSEIKVSSVTPPEEGIINWFCANENSSEKIMEIIDSL